MTASAGEAPHGWVCYNAGPGEWFWSAERSRLEHELSDDIRPATHLEKYLLNKQDNRTHEYDDPASMPIPALAAEQRELVLLQIIAAMGGATDSSESKWSWLNWFCDDEDDGQLDTFNRCDEKGWLSTSHNTSHDTSTSWLTSEGKEVLEKIGEATPKKMERPARSIARAPFPQGVENALKENRRRALGAAKPIGYISGETSQLLERGMKQQGELLRVPSGGFEIPVYDTDSIFKAADALLALPMSIARPEECRGEMTSERAIYFLNRFKSEEKLLGPHERWAIDFAVAALAANVSVGDRENPHIYEGWDVEIIARAINPSSWRTLDVLCDFFARGVGANQHQEAYGLMYRAGVKTAEEARAWLMEDQTRIGWGLKKSLETADKVLSVLEFTDFAGLQPSDMVDKAVAWDQCVESSRKARASALEEAAQLIDNNMLCSPDGVEGVYPRSNPGNTVGFAYAVAIRALAAQKGTR
jgi:hypothetical protein